MIAHLLLHYIGLMYKPRLAYIKKQQRKKQQQEMSP